MREAEDLKNSASFCVPLNPFIFNYYSPEEDERQPENREKQGEVEVSRAIQFWQSNSRS